MNKRELIYNMNNCEVYKNTFKHPFDGVVVEYVIKHNLNSFITKNFESVKEYINNKL